jgi:hypothetical protein
LVSRQRHRSLRQLLLLSQRRLLTGFAFAKKAGCELKM